MKRPFLVLSHRTKSAQAQGRLAGVGDPGRNANRQSRKKELVILLKPTVLQGARDWEESAREAAGRIQKMHRSQPAGQQPR